MSNFWDELSENAKKGFNMVADKTGELVNKGKDVIDITKLKYTREQKYSELGKMLYEQMQQDLLNISGLQNKCTELMQLNEAIAALEEE